MAESDVEAMRGKKWMYVDAQGGQKGPMNESVLKKLLRRGMVHGETYVWSPDLPNEEWKMAMSIPLFKTICILWQKIPQWYYYDHLKAQQGPITTTELVKMFEEGDIDGLTMVWSSCQIVESWTAMGEVATLKQELQEINEEREREEALLETQKKIDPKLQTFSEEASTSRAIIAEDGKEFIYDTETRKWVTTEDKIREELEDLAEDREDSKGTSHIVGLDENDDIAQEISKNAIAQADKQPIAEDGSENPKKRKKSKKKKSKWSTSKQKTWVYITGLPLDVTIQEVHDHFVKCGVIQRDLHTDEPKIKLYQNKDTGKLNGDGSVCYMKEASVELALQLLDKSDIRPNFTIEVTVAVFSQKGEKYVERKRQRLDNRAKVKKLEQEKALSWGATGDEQMRIVVLKNMFTLEDFADAVEGQELKDDIKKECEILGEIAKITFFEKNPLGVVIIKYVEAESAEDCIDKMNGRWFAGKKIECSYWDGTNYVIKESEEEQQKRIEDFGEWLEEGSSGSGTDESDDEPQQVHSGRVLPDLDEEVHSGRELPELEDDE